MKRINEGYIYMSELYENVQEGILVFEIDKESFEDTLVYINDIGLQISAWIFQHIKEQTTK